MRHVFDRLFRPPGAAETPFRVALSVFFNYDFVHKLAHRWINAETVGVHDIRPSDNSAPDRLTQPRGHAVPCVAAGAQVAEFVRGEFRQRHRIVGEISGLFRDYYYADQRFLSGMAAVAGADRIRDGMHEERLMIFEAIVGAA